MESGWIKVHRQLKDWEWYGNPNMVALWIHLLISAAYEDKVWRGLTIKRGTLITSMAKLSAEVGLSSQTLRTCIDKLIRSGEITKQSTNEFTIITICHYDNYQLVSDTDQQTSNTTNQPAEQQTSNATNQPHINKRRRGEGKKVLPSSGEEGLSGCEAPPTTQEAVDYERLVVFFNETTKGCFGMLRYPLGDARKKLIRARVAQFGKKALEEVIKKAAASDFLKGQNQRGFTATFDWLILPKNFEKVLSGNYDNKDGQPRSSSGRDIIGTNFIDKD